MWFDVCVYTRLYLHAQLVCCFDRRIAAPENMHSTRDNIPWVDNSDQEKLKVESLHTDTQKMALSLPLFFAFLAIHRNCISLRWVNSRKWWFSALHSPFFSFLIVLLNWLIFWRPFESTLARSSRYGNLVKCLAQCFLCIFIVCLTESDLRTHPCGRMQ